jgi:hypothetical protein
MVNWITTQIAIKSPDEPLTEKEYGAIIIDLQDVPNVSFADLNEATKKATMADAVPQCLTTIQKIFKIVANRDLKVILQSGYEKAPLFVAAILVYGTLMTWDDAIDFVKAKFPDMKVNEDLLLCIKVALSG